MSDDGGADDAGEDQVVLVAPRARTRPLRSARPSARARPSRHAGAVPPEQPEPEQAAEPLDAPVADQPVAEQAEPEQAAEPLDAPVADQPQPAPDRRPMPPTAQTAHPAVGWAPQPLTGEDDLLIDSSLVAPKQPLLVRLLRLQHVRPSGWQRAAVGDLPILIAVVLVLGDLATAWTLLVLPAAVLAMVKFHDLIESRLAPVPPTRTAARPYGEAAGGAGDEESRPPSQPVAA